MTRSLSTRIAMSVAVVAAVAAAAFAAPAVAVPPTPAQNAMLLQASDLPASYGKPTDSSDTNASTGGFMSACMTAHGDNPGTKFEDQTALYSQLVYPSGMMWSQDINVYKSAAQATKAFAQLVAVLPQCNGSSSTTKGDDNITMPKRTTTVTATVKKGVIITTTTEVTTGKGTPRYANQYMRTLIARVSNAIESLLVVSPKPLTKAELAKQDSTFASLLTRYKG